MPKMPRKACVSGGCHELAVEGSSFCVRHKAERDAYKKLKESKRKRLNYKRLGSAERGYNWRWQKARRIFLNLPENHWCVMCRQNGIYRAAQHVDHIQPHRMDYDLFWNQSNWQPLCHSHHSEKTAKERRERRD